MKNFEIDVAPYPRTYEIRAKTEKEAKDIADERFFDDTGGASIYETIVVSEEEIKEPTFTMIIPQKCS